MRMKHLALAAGALLLSAGIAQAATVTNDLNLRSGPGTRYGVVDTMPAGADVDVIGCGGAWCRVNWQGRVGYASSSYLSGGGPVYAEAPPVYVRPPAIGFGFGFDGGWRGDRDGGWWGDHHGHHR